MVGGLVGSAELDRAGSSRGGPRRGTHRQSKEVRMQAKEPSQSRESSLQKVLVSDNSEP